VTLKLYLWEDVEALAEYATGRALALASSKGEAIDLFVVDDGRASLRAELEATEPLVFESPVGFAFMGSA